jgi:3-phenylpropionate/trans-cinnamate dioxygenase ferredoxin component
MLTEFVKVASVGDLPGNGVLALAVGDEEVMVARIGDDYFALDGWCSHEAGLLGEGHLHEGTCEIECPVHEGFFDLKTGAATAPPADMPVTVYVVRIEGDDIMVGPQG